METRLIIIIIINLFITFSCINSNTINKNFYLEKIKLNSKNLLIELINKNNNVVVDVKSINNQIIITERQNNILIDSSVYYNNGNLIWKKIKFVTKNNKIENFVLKDFYFKKNKVFIKLKHENESLKDEVYIEEFFDGSEIINLNGIDINCVVLKIIYQYPDNPKKILKKYWNKNYGLLKIYEEYDNNEKIWFKQDIN